MSFQPDFPAAIVYPAHSTNYYRPGEYPHYHAPNKPRGWVLHTPEEPADDVPSTPRWFAGANRQASTHYFVALNGDVYQLVPEIAAAIANGVLGKPYPSWADASTSLNWQSLSVEIEGYAATIHETLSREQFGALVELIRDRARAHGISLDREHVIGHYQVSTQRTDPGSRFPWETLMAALSEEDDRMIRVNAIAGWFDGRDFSSGVENGVMQAASDFGLPPDARAVRMEIELDGGALAFGDPGYCGRVDASCGARLGIVDARLSEQGTINFAASVGTVVRRIACLGYWR